ncbi:MAG: DUF192 domain-containing protein [Pseudomonadota bacterium]
MIFTLGVVPVAHAQTSEILPVTILTADHDRFVFMAEVARTPATRSQGLMNRPHLPADRGMLFVFDPPQSVSFWMKNTLISLDIIFIAEDGTIRRIAQQTTPHSTTPLPSGGAVSYVLEIAGGRALELGITVGDRVVVPAP